MSCLSQVRQTDELSIAGETAWWVVYPRRYSLMSCLSQVMADWCIVYPKSDRLMSCEVRGDWWVVSVSVMYIYSFVGWWMVCPAVLWQLAALVHIHASFMPPTLPLLSRYMYWSSPRCLQPSSWPPQAYTCIIQLKTPYHAMYTLLGHFGPGPYILYIVYMMVWWMAGSAWLVLFYYIIHQHVGQSMEAVY